MQVVYYFGLLNLFQKDATNALEKMTLVLKAGSKAGERYESLYEGAKSLVNGLGSMLRVASHGARVYDSQSQGKFQIEASVVDAYEKLSHKSREKRFRSRVSSLRHSLERRTKRDDDAQLQVKNRLEPRV